MQGDAGGGAAGFMALGLGFLACWGVFALAINAFCWWKVFVKANQPGWASMVPFYNLYCLTQVAGRPAWWLVLMFIPFVNLVIIIILGIDISARFGRGGGTAAGPILLPIPFHPILGFGSATLMPKP